MKLLDRGFAVLSQLITGFRRCRIVSAGFGLGAPYVQALGPGDGHWAVLCQLLRAVGTAGNLTSDAHLAAMAMERGCDVYSTDGDFARFPGLRHVNPLV